jgi:hypothetical protein
MKPPDNFHLNSVMLIKIRLYSDVEHMDMGIPARQSYSEYFHFFFFLWGFVRLLALRPLLAYCAILG